jgi:hypothetical protein
MGSAADVRRHIDFLLAKTFVHGLTESDGD